MKRYKFIKVVETCFEQNIEAENIKEAKKQLKRDVDAWEINNDLTHVDRIDIYEEEKGTYYRKEILTWDDWYRKNY